MAQSPKFNDLTARLDELRRHMLPEVFSPTGDYNEKEIDLAKGYKILVHAEFESYFEEISKEVVLEAVKIWKKNKKPTSVIVSLITSYHSSWCIDNESTNDDIITIAKSRLNIKDSVNKVIDLALTQYITRVNANNGIKEVNFKTLILPTGISSSEIDPAWLLALDKYGGARGELAHNSKNKVKNLINPQDELQLANDLLVGIQSLDERLVSLMA